MPAAVRRSPRTASSLLMALLLLVIGGLSAPGAAAAGAPALPTTLSFYPAKGLVSTPMYVVVPRPCPAGATNVLAVAFGHGFPAEGQTVISNSTLGISYTAPFVLPLQDTFTGFAADNGTTIHGAYQVTLRCITRLRTKTFASFTAAITFSDGVHYTAPSPTKAVIDAVNASTDPTQPQASGPAAAQPSGGGKATAGPSGAASAAPGTSPGSTASAAPGATGGTAAPAAGGNQSPAAATGKKSSGGAWEPILIVGALLLIGLGVLLRVREVRGGRRREAERRAAKSKAGTAPSDSTPALSGSSNSKNQAKGNDS